MARLFTTRCFAFVCLAVTLVGLARMNADDPCYQSITSLPCPSATGSFDTCEVQWSNLPLPKSSTQCQKR